MQELRSITGPFSYSSARFNPSSQLSLDLINSISNGKNHEDQERTDSNSNSSEEQTFHEQNEGKRSLRPRPENPPKYRDKRTLRRRSRSPANPDPTPVKKKRGRPSLRAAANKSTTNRDENTRQNHDNTNVEHPKKKMGRPPKIRPDTEKNSPQKTVAGKDVKDQAPREWSDYSPEDSEQPEEPERPKETPPRRVLRQRPEDFPISSRTRLRRPGFGRMLRTAPNPRDDVFAIPGEESPTSRKRETPAESRDRREPCAYSSGSGDEDEGEESTESGQECGEGDQRPTRENSPEKVPHHGSQTTEIDEETLVPQSREKSHSEDINNDPALNGNDTDDDEGDEQHDEDGGEDEHDDNEEYREDSDEMKGDNAVESDREREDLPRGPKAESRLMNKPPVSFLELSDVFGQEATWCELAVEASELSKQAPKTEPTSLSERVLSTIQTATDAYEGLITANDAADPGKDLIWDFTIKISSLLTNVEPVSEEKLGSMSPGQICEWSGIVLPQIVEIQTRIVPAMAQLIPSMVDAFHNLGCSKEKGLLKISSLLKLTSSICDKIKPDYYPAEYLTFPDRLKTVRIAARFLLFVFDTELSKIRSDAPQQSSQEASESIAQASLPHATPQISLPSPSQSPEKSTPAPTPSPAPAASNSRKQSPWTDAEEQTLLEALQKFQGMRFISHCQCSGKLPLRAAYKIAEFNCMAKGPDRYANITNELGEQLSGRSTEELRVKAAEIRDAYVAERQLEGRRPLNPKRWGWLLDVD